MKFMTDKPMCFIDSNVWLYAFIESQDIHKSQLAKSLIQNDTLTITISTQVINEICSNLIRKAKFSEQKIQQLVSGFYKRYKIVEINQEILLNASKIREHHQFSFWDSLIVSSAAYVNAEILYSEDMHDGFCFENTKIINPLL